MLMISDLCLLSAHQLRGRRLIVDDFLDIKANPFYCVLLDTEPPLQFQ